MAGPWYQYLHLAGTADTPVCFFFFPAFPMNRRQQCHCRRSTLRKVVRTNIEKICVYPQSPTCSRTEIVPKLKKTFEKCLDPESKIGKLILSENFTTVCNTL
uniref:Chemokine interleukin-8-like domain-containing protein n=1 Tax=Denticeps clupeoides TaxID=299321 RepID=A0AAY4BP35_9TELE